LIPAFAFLLVSWTGTSENQAHNQYLRKYTSELSAAIGQLFNLYHRGQLPPLTSISNIQNTLEDILDLLSKHKANDLRSLRNEIILLRTYWDLTRRQINANWVLTRRESNLVNSLSSLQSVMNKLIDLLRQQMND
jgi:hypothetical protein